MKILNSLEDSQWLCVQFLPFKKLSLGFMRSGGHEVGMSAWSIHIGTPRPASLGQQTLQGVAARLSDHLPHVGIKVLVVH